MESVMTIKACLIQNRNLAPLSQVNPIVRQLSKYIQSLRVFPCPLEQLSTDTKLGHQTNSKLDPQWKTTLITTILTITEAAQLCQLDNHPKVWGLKE